METKLTERQKQKLCELIEKSLNRVRLQNYKTDDDDNLPLVDMLSNGDTILEGQEEIANIIEQIFFDMDAWDISLKPVEIPEISDEEIQKYVTERFSNSHLLPEIIAFRAIKYYQKGLPLINGNKCCLDGTEKNLKNE